MGEQRLKSEADSVTVRAMAQNSAHAAPSYRDKRKAELLMQRAEALLLSDHLRAERAVHLDGEAAWVRAAELSRERPELGLEARVSQLSAALSDAAEYKRYIGQFGCIGVRRFGASTGERIYLIPAETFPKHINNIYLIVYPGGLLLFDTGSGLDSSRRDLELGFAIMREVYGEPVHFEDIGSAVISHAHIDHFGGINDLISKSKAKLCVHELDARVLSGFEERVIVVVKDVEVFLRRAGADVDTQKRLISLYLGSRDRFHSVDIQNVLCDGDLAESLYPVIHTPGHCPGQICLQIGDILLTSDHILSRITPHQFPQAITPFAGLGHYFRSLEKIKRREGIRLALGGHEEPILNVRGRIDEIVSFHKKRLDEVLSICEKAHTISEISAALFGDQSGYGELLALEEAGAHVEYLHELGKLRIANLDEVASARDPVICYQAKS